MTATTRRPGSSTPGLVQTSGQLSALNDTVELALNGQDSITFEVLPGGWVGTVVFQLFLEGTGWISTVFHALNTGIGAGSGINTTGPTVRTGFCGFASSARVIASPWTSGTAQVNIRAGRTLLGSTPVNVLGTTATAGSVARGGAVTAVNPLLIGVRGYNANPSAVSTGTLVEPISTLIGSQVVTPWSIPEATWSYAVGAGGLTSTADSVLASAPGVGQKRYINTLSLSNNSATATEVVVKSNTTVIARFHLPANAPNVCHRFEPPLAAADNTVLNIACITTGAAVYANAQGFTAP